MKPIDVTGDSNAKYNEDFNKRDPKFKVCDHARISFLLKDMLQIRQKKILLLAKLKLHFFGLMLLVT